MNKQQFISTWAPENKREEMLTDLEAVIKDELEERQIFIPK